VTEGRRWTLLVVCLATGVLLLNVAAPNVALPAVGRDLGALLPPGTAAGQAGAFTAAHDDILLVSAAVATIGAVLALLLVRQRDFVVEAAPQVPSRGR
jgi:hypothetical protein